MATPLDEHEAGIDDLLVEMLRRRDVSCPICRYNLRNLTGNVCPECGQAFTLRIGSVTPRFGILLLFLAPMLMMAGFTLLIGVLVIIQGPPPAPALGIYLILASGFLEAVAVIFIYRKRAAFLRRSKLVQLLVTGFVWAVNVAIFVIASRYGF